MSRTSQPTRLPADIYESARKTWQSVAWHTIAERDRDVIAAGYKELAAESALDAEFDADTFGEFLRDT